MDDLTPMQYEVLQAAKWLKMKNPELGLSVQDIATHLGRPHPTVDFHVRALIRKKRLTRTPGKHRSLRVAQ
jgi:DNA-binding NarL/FixJ family response regulator